MMTSKTKVWMATLFVVLFPLQTQAVKVPLNDIIGHWYYDAIDYLYSKNIVQGYPDHSYQPSRDLNRAEFTKIVVGAVLGNEPAKPSANCFPDVDKNQWYATWVCHAKKEGIIGGYQDGLFKPNEKINLAEAAKILVNTLKVPMSSVKSSVWYEVYLRSLQDLHYVPDSFADVSELVNRGQMAEMIYRILEKLTDRPAKTFIFESKNSVCQDADLPGNIDIKALRQAWLDWHNEARDARGIGLLSMNTGLDYSSSLWAQSNEAMNKLTHDRPDGKSLTNWFSEIGIQFKPLSGIIFGENLGYSTFRCSQSDCTQKAIDSARVIFDAFMAEEQTSFTGHYDNIVTPDFVELGLGIAIDSSNELMYLATHYSFGVKSYPSNLCTP